MLRTASSLPLAGLLTLGSGPARFQTEPPACYRASWQLPGPDFHRQATTSLRTARSTTTDYVTASPPILLGARKAEVRQHSSRSMACGHEIRADTREALTASSADALSRVIRADYRTAPIRREP